MSDRYRYRLFDIKANTETYSLNDKDRVRLIGRGYRISSVGVLVCDINDRSSSKIDAVPLSQLQRHCNACVIEWTGWEATTIDIYERATSVAVWGLMQVNHEYLAIVDTIAAHQAPPLSTTFVQFRTRKASGKWRSSFPSESPIRAVFPRGNKDSGWLITVERGV